MARIFFITQRWKAQKRNAILGMGILKDLVERSDTVKNVLCFHMGEAVFVSLHVFTTKIFLKNVKQSFCYQQCLTKAT